MMLAPIMRSYTGEQARDELVRLVAQAGGNLGAFEERAHCYDLKTEEVVIWDRIRELQWLLDNSRATSAPVDDEHCSIRKASNLS